MKTDTPSPKTSWLERIERAGNKLPDPATLFVIGAVLVVLLSQVAVWSGWSVQPVRPELVTAADGTETLELIEEGDPIEAVGLLTSDGIYYMFTSLVDNFINFPPLGVVLVGMLGIGIAERTGMIAALLKGFLRIVPIGLLTPAMVFLGIMSSLATDAGYIVLPPLAMAIYKAVGKSPIVGLAAVFAGVSAGFNANLVVTGLDPLLAGLSTSGAQILDPNYAVAATSNWYFMIASTVVMTAAGWWVTAKLVEPRFTKKSEEDGGPPAQAGSLADARRMTDDERIGLLVAGIAFAVVAFILGAMILQPGWPLYGSGPVFDRWVEAIVPIIFLFFIIPGIAYGIAVKAVKSEKDFAKMLMDSMAAMAPIIVLAFFAAQFIAYFNESNLGVMLAMSGGQTLTTLNMPIPVLIVAFILVTVIFNLFVGSMSAKYALFAPIFIPMFMILGISPELTQAAYRIGDSVSNVITPLNSYLIIILVAMRRYVPKAGMGTLVSTMLPYTLVFLLVWTLMLLGWMAFDIPLGPRGTGPLTYPPSG